MTLQDAPLATHAPIDSERLADLELALGLQDIDADGFRCGVREACVAAGFVFLFDLPTIDDEDVSRVAAAATADEEGDPVFAYVALHSDSDSVSVDAQCPSLDHAEAVASAYLDLMVLQ